MSESGKAPLVVIHMARKPLEGTVAETALKHGTGSLNIGVSRIGYQNEADMRLETRGVHVIGAYEHSDGPAFKRTHSVVLTPAGRRGRWPANVILEHLPECQLLGAKRISAPSAKLKTDGAGKGTGADAGGVYGGFGKGRPAGVELGHADAEGKETVANWLCAPGCPVADLDEQSGVSFSSGGRIGNKDGGIAVPGGQYKPGDPGFGDKGGASRYFKQIGGSRDE